jgi:hypothetical protein
MTFEETEAEYYKLKAAGHAVLFDVVHNYKGELQLFRSHHYLTCAVCAREKDAKHETTN